MVEEMGMVKNMGRTEKEEGRGDRQGQSQEKKMVEDVAKDRTRRWSRRWQERTGPKMVDYVAI
jgi:hypothetical protein